MKLLPWAFVKMEVLTVPENMENKEMMTTTPLKFISCNILFFYTSHFIILYFLLIFFKSSKFHFSQDAIQNYFNQGTLYYQKPIEYGVIILGEILPQINKRRIWNNHISRVGNSI